MKRVLMLSAVVPLLVFPVQGAAVTHHEVLVNASGDLLLSGQEVSVDVKMTNRKMLHGYGFVLNYNPDRFEFVRVVPAEFTAELLRSGGGEPPEFTAQVARPGRLLLANASGICDAGVFEGTGVYNGTVTTVVFKVLQSFESDARIEIAEGVLLGPDVAEGPMALLLKGEGTPTGFELFQNFPNPFNPETQIVFHLPQAAEISLVVYNVQGQQVRVLGRGYWEAGAYQTRWDGLDASGRPVSSGVYFYRLTADAFQAQRPMLLLK